MIVRIVRAQKINKVKYEVGDRAVFPDSAGQWLIDQGIAEADGAPAEVEPIPPAPAPLPKSRKFAPAMPRFKCCGWK